MAASVSNLTGVGLVTTITNPGIITLPLVTTTPNRQVIFKDTYGNLSNKPLVFLTQGSDTFENGSSNYVLNNSFGSVTFYGVSDKWYVLGGNNQFQTTISSLTVSSINGSLPGSGSLTIQNLLSTTAGLGTAGYVSSLSLVSTTAGVTSNYSTFLSTTLANYTFPYSGQELYLNYSVSVSPYQQLGINNIIGPSFSNVTSVPGGSNDYFIAGFQTDFYLQQFIATGIWTVTLFSQAANTSLSIYASLFTRNPTTSNETQIATSSNSPQPVLTTKVALDLTVDVPYTTLVPDNTLVLKIFANNTAGGSRDLTTFYENGNYSHVNTNLATGGIQLVAFNSTIEGLGTLGYVSTLSLISTTAGLQNNLVSTTGGLVEVPELVSTTGGITRGYLTSGYLSTLSLISTTSGFQTSLVSTVEGLGTLGYISTGGQGYFSSVTINMLPQDAPYWEPRTYPALGFDPEPQPLALDIFGSARILKNLYIGSTTTIIGTSGVATAQISSASVLTSSLLMYDPTANQVVPLRIANGNLVFNGSNLLTAAVGSNQQFLSTPNLISTTGGLQREFLTAGYLSTLSLISTTTGVQNNLVSTTGGLVQASQLISTTGGLVQASQLISTTGGLVQASQLISTTGGLIEASQLISTTGGLIEASQLISTTGGLIEASQLISTTGGLIEASQLISTTGGLIEAPQLISTTGGITTGYLTAGFLSSFNAFSMSTGRINTSTLTFVDINTQAKQVLLVSSGVLTLNGQAASSGGGTGPGMTISDYVAGGKLDSDQSLTPNADTQIQFVSDFNPQNWYNPDIYEFRPTISGYYLVNFQVLFSRAATSNSDYNIKIQKIGQTYAIGQEVQNLDVGPSITLTKIIYLDGSSDFLNFTAYVGDSANLNLAFALYGGNTNGAGTFFTATLLTNGSSGGNLLSTVSGLGSAGYVSTLSLISTTASLQMLGMIPFISALTVSTGLVQASSITNINIEQSSSNFWLAGGDDITQVIKYSGDGLSWSNVAGSKVFSDGCYNIGWNGNLWVAAGSDNSINIKYSGNGLNWSNTTGGLDSFAWNVAWNGRLWVAVGGDSAQSIKYSYDGISWSNVAGSNIFSGVAYGAAWNGSMWIAVGGDATQSIKYSYDGINWLNVPGANLFNSYGFGIAWNGRMWVASGADTTQSVKYSYNGLNWSNVPGSNIFSGLGRGVAWNGNMWVVVGNDSNQNVKYSYDGINWSNASGSKVYSSSAFRVSWNGNMWITIGDDTTQNIKYSYNGINWSNVSASNIFSLGGRGLAYSSNVFPSYNQTNFEIEPQNIPIFIRSTNQLSFTQSTIIANNTLFVDATNKVGINIGTPATDLDVNGIGRFITASSFSGFFSSINTINPSSWVTTLILVSTTAGLQTSLVSTTGGITRGYLTSGYLSTLSLISTTRGLQDSLVSTTGGLVEAPELVSTIRGLSNVAVTQIVAGTNITISPGGVGAVTINAAGGGGAAIPFLSAFTVSTGAIYTSSISSIAIVTSSLQVNALTIGTGTGWVNLGPIQAVAISTIQMNTNASFAFTMSSFQGNFSSVGIGCNAPTVALDVHGTIEGLIVSSFRMNTSSIVSPTSQISSMVTSSISFGATAGWVRTNLMQGIVFSSIQTNTALGYVSSLLVGTPSTNSFQVPFFNLHLVANSAAKPVNTSWTIGSDIRIKENVTNANLDRCYEDIRSVQLRRFMWRQEYFNSVQGVDRHVLGFLAQEVSTIVPKAVETIPAYGYSDFQFLNIDQLNMSLYGAVKRTIQDKEVLESTVKGQKFQIETLVGTQTMILSTLNGLQGR